MYDLPEIDLTGFQPRNLTAKLRHDGGKLVIKISYEAPDSCSPSATATVAMIGSCATIPAEGVLTGNSMFWQGELLSGLVRAMEHELMETIKVNGVRVFTPHPGPRIYSFPPNDKATSFPSSPEELAAQRASLARPR